MIPGICFKDDSVVIDFVMPPAIREMFAEVCATAPAMHENVVMVTSARDGSHSGASHHFNGRAIDVRCYGAVDLDGNLVRRRGMITAGDRAAQVGIAELWCDRLKKTLGPHYDVVLESDHIHIEHEPSRAKSGPDRL